MKNFNYLFTGILMIGMGFALVLPAVARTDYQDRKLETVEEYHLRQAQMEDLIARQMSNGMDFEASYLVVKQMLTSRQTQSPVFWDDANASFSEGAEIMVESLVSNTTGTSEVPAFEINSSGQKDGVFQGQLSSEPLGVGVSPDFQLALAETQVSSSGVQDGSKVILSSVRDDLSETMNESLKEKLSVEPTFDRGNGKVLNSDEVVNAKVARTGDAVNTTVVVSDTDDILVRKIAERDSADELPIDFSAAELSIDEDYLRSARAVQIAKATDMAQEYRKEKTDSLRGQDSQTASDMMVLAQASGVDGNDLQDFSDRAGLADKRSDAMDVRDLTIQDLQAGSRFEEDYTEAYKHDYHRKAEPGSASLSGAGAGDFEVIQGVTPGLKAGSGVMTPEEIIRQVISQENRSRKMDLHFDQTNLGDVMMTLGETGGINIVLDPALYENKLDLHLKQVSLEEAMMLLSNIYDLGFEKVGKSLYVTHKDKLSDRKMESRVVKLRNIGVSDARLLVKDLAHTVNASEELNSLVIIGSPEQLVKIESVLAQVDVPQPQVIIEAKILEINKDALKDLGVDWSDQISLQYQEADRPQSFDGTVTGSVENVFEIGKIARNAIQFETTIKMLENQNKAKILSNPRVTTLNGKEAEIFVGDKIPYTITNVTGGVVTTDVRFVEPGIRLKITPSIIDREFVILRVDPEVSFIFAFRGPNDEYPQVKSREATAHVRVKNQTPFVIGGLLNQEDKQSLFKVPFLGDVPLIGNLFSYQKNSVADTELIITILPTIVTGSMQ